MSLFEVGFLAQGLIAARPSGGGDGEANQPLFLIGVGGFVLALVVAALQKPKRCEICGNSLKRTRYEWTVSGKRLNACPNCNRKLERAKSKAAFDNLKGNAQEAPSAKAPKLRPAKEEYSARVSPPAPIRSFKLQCSNCGQHISATSELSGSTCPCPSCGHPVTVPMARESEIQAKKRPPKQYRLARQATSFQREDLATEAQLSYLEDLGGVALPKMTKRQAGAAIENLISRDPATSGQLRRLKFYGAHIPDQLSKKAASEMIDRYIEEHPGSEESYQTWKQQNDR